MASSKKSKVLPLERLMGLDWDVLIVLDACRFDYFTKVYREFLKGVLRRGFSPVTKTGDWVKVVFNEKYDDVVYVSANPIINSKAPVWGFDAKRYFYKVVDVWDWGWSEEWGSVPPWEVNNAALSVFKDFPNKKLIIHYMQPHAPYAPIAYVFKDYRIGDPFTLVGLRGPVITSDFKTYGNYARKSLYKETSRLLSTLSRSLTQPLPRWIPRQSLLWKLRKMLNIPPKSPEELFYRRFSIREIQLMYELNLRCVLKYVSELMRDTLNLNKSLKIVITSDHGELLGERGEIGHDVGYNLPKRYELKLREVPWFEVLEPIQSVTKWYGEDPYALKIARYFEMAERKLRAKKVLMARIQRVRRKLMSK